MRGGARLLKYWLPVVLWMTLIFSASTGSFSTQQTSRIIGPFLRWLIPDVSDETIYGVQFVVRKGAHVGEYAVLALLFWWAIRQPARGQRRPWSWREAGIAFACSVLYAISDELHQSFVPSRQGSPVDVMIDTAGAVLGLCALWGVGRWRQWW